MSPLRVGWTISRKVGVLFAGQVVLISFFMAHFITRHAHIRHAIRDIETEYLPLAQRVHALRALHALEQTALASTAQNALIERGRSGPRSSATLKRYSNEFRRELEGIRASTQRLWMQRSVAIHPEAERVVEKLHQLDAVAASLAANHGAWTGASDRLFAPDANRDNLSAVVVTTDRLNALLLSDIGNLIELSHSLTALGSRAVDAYATRSMREGLILGVVLFAVSAVSGFWFVRRQRDYLLRMARAMRRVSDRLRQDIPEFEAVRVTSQDEIGNLAAAFNEMAETLRTNILARQDAQALLAEQAQELKRAHDELLQLVFVSSHDLQTPIRAVVSYAQLLARRYRNKLDAKGTEYLHYAVDGMLRMQELVNDLLVYLQIRAGDREPQPTDCNAVFQDAMSRLLLDVERLQARVTCDLLPVVAADRTQITALFAHLLDNALKFRRDVPPEVHVSATKRRGEWLFSVSDNGIGIESAMYERIFGIFQRLHPPDRYPGTGIGLALAKRIVERHGGRIWLDSTPGVGTTFYFTLLERPSWTEPTGVNGALPTIGKGTFEHG